MRRARKEKPELNRKYDIKKKYKMTLEDYGKRIQEQDGKCAACGAEESGEKSGAWHIDHDPSCCPTRSRTCGACVRGLLCRNCNIALGITDNNIQRLQGMIRYLQKFEGSKALFKNLDPPQTAMPDPD